MSKRWKFQNFGTRLRSQRNSEYFEWLVRRYGSQDLDLPVLRVPSRPVIAMLPLDMVDEQNFEACEICLKTVDAYYGDISTNGLCAPLVVDTFDNGYLLDGWHRLHAIRQLDPSDSAAMFPDRKIPVYCMRSSPGEGTPAEIWRIPQSYAWISRPDVQARHRSYIEQGYLGSRGRPRKGQRIASHATKEVYGISYDPFLRYLLSVPGCTPATPRFRGHRGEQIQKMNLTA